MPSSRIPVALSIAIGVCLAMWTHASTSAQACAFTVDFSTATVGAQSEFVQIHATVAEGCTFTASSTVPWMTVHASTVPLSTTRLLLSATIAENTTGAARQGGVLLNGQPAVTIAQLNEPCVSGFDPSTVRTNAAGDGRSTSLLTSAPDCMWRLGGWPTWAGFPSPLGGRGPATINFSTFMPNWSGPARSADLSYSGRLLRVEQDAPTCLFTTTPAEIDMPANGGTGSFLVTGVGTDCVYSTQVWSDHAVSITSGATGTAPATVSFTVKPNLLPDNTWYIQVRNAQFRIRQNGAPIRTDGRSPAFSAALGPSGIRLSTPPVSVRITNIEQANADYTATADRPWVVVTPSSGQTPAELTVSFDPAQVAMLPPGFHSSFVKLVSSIAPVSTTGFTVSLRVYGAGETWAPFGVFETPRHNTAAAGAIPVTGWAVDAFGISKVAIYRDAVQGEPPGLVFIGDAIRVRGARPDVVHRTNAPDADLAGWGYMLLTNVLPGGDTGTFTLHAFADNTEGTRVLLGSRTIMVNNAAAITPFGTIDVPAQGETVSGTLVNLGWVLTPAGKTIPLDGSTIKVYIDGVLLSPVTSYNVPRPDVKAFFPGLANSEGPEARLTIDTTLLADGVHTIAWGVIDDAGIPEGIGSRFFTVQNGAASQVPVHDTSRAAAPLARMPVLKTDVWSREGVDDLAWATRVETDAKGRRSLRAAPGQRLELFLDPTLRAACGTYDGHLLTGDVAGPLPVGASLDKQHGIFRWLPPVQTRGAFEFVFVQRGCDTIERRISVGVVIEPGR